ncbi:MAG: hypothetical protein IJO32_01590 [Bacilli bacterium]|nr:hypothetical protein [Bacilli bacterium]
MVCKKCGNELTDGINICPFCGEGSNQEKTKTPEINSFINDLNNLKIDINNEKEDIEENKLSATLKDIQEFTQDLSNLKFEIEEAEKSNVLENDDSNISQENINEVTQDLSNLKFELDELEREKILNNNIENNVNKINEGLDNLKFDIENFKEDSAYVLDEVKVEPHVIEQETDNLIEEKTPEVSSDLKTNVEINNIDINENGNEDVKKLDINSELQIELETLPEEKVDAEIFEEQTPNDSEEIADSDSIKILPDIDLQVLPKLEELRNDISEPKENTDKNNLNDLINDLKGIKIEDSNIDETLQNSNIENLQKIREEEEKRLNIYDLVKELRNINVEGINSVPKTEIPIIPEVSTIEEEPKVEKKFENDYLFKTIPEDIDNNEENVVPIEQEEVDIPDITLPPLPEIPEIPQISKSDDLNNEKTNESSKINEQDNLIHPEESEVEENTNNIDDIKTNEETIVEQEEIDIPEMTLPPFPEIPEVPEIPDNLTDFIESTEENEEHKQEVFINNNLVETQEEIKEETSVVDKDLQKKDRTFMIVFIIVAIIGIALAIYLGYLLSQ